MPWVNRPRSPAAWKAARTCCAYTTQVRFEWDHQKAVSNLRKHGVSFEEGVSVFYDPLAASFVDPDHSLGEARFVAVGYSRQNRLLVVAYAERAEVIRIISVRDATSHEKKRHETENRRPDR